jgi:prepilin-type N-terminal cleavage/methylation domain-containing protein
MKSKPNSLWHRWQMRSRQSLRPKKRPFPSSKQGFTLIELLVATLITSVVILVAWSGLISAMGMSQAAEARSARQTELNKALDFMTNEIRMARSINESGTLAANGTTVTLADVITSAGVNPSALGSHGTISLYLERPTQANIPAICPVGGPNAGAPPPTPADFDPIVYDIRPSPSGWLQPRMVARYGRVPSSDGTINPCSSPISSDPMIDALSTVMKTAPTCSGVLSGDGGFYSCVNGQEVNLFLQSDIDNAQVKQVSSAVSSRVLNIQPQVASPSGCPGESSLRSLPGQQKAEIVFVNQKNVPVKVYWIDYSGVRDNNFDLMPNQTLKQKTFMNNPWVVTDASDVCSDIFVATSKKMVATIQ